ncbi:MAG: hypothetical protein ACPL1K_02240 [Candidatus Kryptoniota bacterium]
MVAQNEINRVEIFLQMIAGQIETLRQGIFDLSDETGFYTLATDWQEAMSMVDVLNKMPLTPEQRKRFDDLLNELERVKPIAEKLNLV